MVSLTDEHVSFIIKDLHHRGLVVEGFEDELVDHICAAVEKEMEGGARFIDAYQKIIEVFGATSGLQRVQHEVVRSKNIKSTYMLKNHLLVALRNLSKQRFYAFINVFGLAVGVAACLVMILYIVDELSYDRHFTNAERIYRVDADVRFGGNEFKMTYRSAPEAQALLAEFPEVESVVRFRLNGSYLVKPADGKENIKEERVVWADSTFFKIFSVNVLEGNPKTALAEPASVAISRKIADKHFPGTSALDQFLLLDNKYQAKVTAIYEDIPAASHFHFDIIVSMVGEWPIAREAASTSFMSENFNTYLLLKPGTHAQALEAKLPQFLEKYMGPEVAQAFGGDFSFEKFRASGNKYDLSLRPLTDIHLHSDIRGEFEPNGSITYVYLLSGVAAFILVIACINFMNLSTARSGNRAKEVGVRKVMGSLRSHLIRQFLTESALITFFSFGVALLIAYLFMPLFNNLAQKQLQLPWTNPIFYLILTGGALVVGLMAGLYPSFFLSAFKPVLVLKGQATVGTRSGLIRSSLVVFQFAISIFLMVGAIALHQQFQFIQNKKLGFDKDQVIIIHDTYALRPTNVEPFKNEVTKLSDVESGTISGFVPVESTWAWRSNGSLWNEGVTPSTENLVSSQLWSIDYDYIPTFQMHLKSGRNFSRAFPSDQHGIIINETAAKRLGLGDDPIGKNLHTFDGAPDPANIQTWKVVGVIDDFHFSSMKENISALGFILGNSDGSVCFRFRPNQAADVISSIEKIWKQMAPGQPFQYSFLDEDFERMYHAEKRLATIFSLFAGLTILIACLGLFALTAFTAEQRTKEIGIRKVLGASIGSIVLLLSKEFGKLVIVSFVVALPLSWFAINRWLESYAYKTTVGLSIYLMAALLVFVLAWLTMSYQSFKAAASDPVKSLKSE